MAVPEAGSVPADDRCFLYGDGLFETLLVIDGRIAFASHHLGRLQLGAQRLAIELPPEPLDCVREAIPTEGVFVVRLTLSRGSGPRGYGSRHAGPPRLLVRTTPLDRDPFVPLPPARVGLSSVVMAEQPMLAGIKHCNRLEQVLAADEAQRAGLDESLLLNSRGSIQCGIAANVFLLSGGHLLTPPCSRSGVAGTRRAVVIEKLAEQCGVKAREEEFGPAELLHADGMVLTSTTIGIRIVDRFGERHYSTQDALLELQARYTERLRECSAA